MPRISRVASELPVDDLPRALIFYEQKLGFVTATRMPDYAVIERDGVAIHLFSERGAGHLPVGVHVFTEDLEELCTEFTRRGAHLSQEILRKPWGNRDFRIKDEFGNELKFTEPLTDERPG